MVRSALRPFLAPTSLVLAAAVLVACQQPGGAAADGPRSAVPQAQALEVHLQPDPVSGTLRTRATWQFAARIPGPVEFDFAGRSGTGRLSLRVFGETGEELATEPLPAGGFRVLEAPGANRIMVEVDAPAAPGLLLPRRGRTAIGLVAEATDSGRAAAWLPIPVGTERVWVTDTHWALPDGWIGFAPSSRRPLAVDGLAWVAGAFVRSERAGDGPTLWMDASLSRFGPEAAATTSAIHDALVATLGQPRGPLEIVFAPGLDGRDDHAAAIDLPGVLVVPQTWLGSEQGLATFERRADLAGALARLWIGTAPQSGSRDLTFWRGLAAHVGAWALARQAGAGAPERELAARRLDTHHAGAAVAGSVDRAAALANLLRASAGDGPFLHALRTTSDALTEPGATPAAFVSALGKAADVELDAVAEPWLTGGGVPDLALDWEWDATTSEVVLEIVQRQASFATAGGLFPATIEVEVSSGSRIDRHVVELDSRSTSARLPAYAQPAWVVLDPTRRLPHTAASLPSRNELFARATSAPSSTGRVLALRDLGALARGTREATTRQLLVAPLSDALSRNPSPWVRATAAQQLASIGGLEARANLERVARRDASPVVRAAALRGLVAWGAEPKLVQLADETFATGGAAWDQRAASAELYASADPAHAGVWISDRMTLESPHGVLRAALLDLWSRTDTPGVAATLTGWLADADASEPVRRTAARRLVALARSSQQEPPGLAAVLDDPDPRWRRAAVEALGRYRSSDAREALRGFAGEATSRTEARAAEAALGR